MTLLTRDATGRLESLTGTNTYKRVRRTTKRDVLSISVGSLIVRRFPTFHDILLALGGINGVGHHLRIKTNRPIRRRFTTNANISMSTLLVFVRRSGIVLFHSPSGLARLVRRRVNVTIYVNVLKSRRTRRPSRKTIRRLNHFTRYFRLLRLLNGTLFVIRLRLTSNHARTKGTRAYNPRLQRGGHTRFLKNMVNGTLILNTTSTSVLRPRVHRDFRLLIGILTSLVHGAKGFFMGTRGARLVRQSLFSRRGDAISNL